MQRFLRLLFACGFAFAECRAFAGDPTALVVPAEGDAFPALLASAKDASFTFMAAKTAKTIPATELIHFGEFVEPRRGPVWLLVNGGVLVADLVEIDKENLRGRSDLFGKPQLALGAVVGVALRPPIDRTRRDALLSKIRSAKGDTDRVILDNGDELTGTIESLENNSLGITTAAGRIDVELVRITAMVFNPALAEEPHLPAERLVVGFTDGSRLVTAAITADAKQMEIKSAGIDWKTRAESLAALQVFGGRAVYLSDIAELSFKHVPYLQLSWPFEKDQNVLGRPLRAAEKIYLKGLGVHTAARVSYKLDGSFKQFQAELAIDDSADHAGSTVCSVFVDDGGGKWQSKYTSPVIRGGQPSVPVRVDLAGAKAISLLADFADHGDERDHVDWLNARLVK